MAILVCRRCKNEGVILEVSYRYRKTYAKVWCGCDNEWVVGGFPGKLTEDDIRQINEKQKAASLQSFNPQMHENKHEIEPQPTAMAIAIAKALGKEN